MAALPKAPFVTPEEYLGRERNAETKSEYHNGVVVAMAGASPEHNAITFNLATEFGAQLRHTPCRGFSGDLRIRVPDCNTYYYPDLSLVCAEPTYEVIEGLRALLNPTVIIEVLSESTESFDRGKKWRCYRTLESLTTYILVTQDRPLIEVYSRMDNGDWRLHTIEGLDGELQLTDIGATIRLADVYAGVELPGDDMTLNSEERPGER
jgi:Uma2 family endonuclease